MRAFRNDELKLFIEKYYEHGWLGRCSVNGGTTQLYHIEEITYDKSETFCRIKVDGTFYAIGELYNKFKFVDPLTQLINPIGVEL